MTTIFTIPLTNVPQRFTIELSGVSYNVVSKWNGESPAWVLDIYDEASAKPLIMNLPLVTGVNLLEQHAHIGIPGQLIAYTDGDEFSPPTLDNLGSDSNLYYIPD